MKRDYFEGADVAVTICAKDGTILDMNAKSKKTFLKPGMPEIIGQNVLDCHPEPARSLTTRLNDEKIAPDNSPRLYLVLFSRWLRITKKSVQHANAR